MATFLRSHRRRAGLTLESVAASAGLTKSYLSKVERGLSTPSIDVALRIARALDTDVSQLFSDGLDGTATTVERGDERARVPEGASRAAVHDAIATRRIRKSMQPFVVHPTTEPGSDYIEHPGEEFVFVQSGTVEFEITNKVIVLEQGDSMYFDANTPHRMRSISANRAVLITVVHDHCSDQTADTTPPAPDSSSAQPPQPDRPRGKTTVS
ncbi:XRE family transcriptional regulator [Rhodococcus sp. ABRD24]|uniref:helix-turn-helix domain-containing protein n=1 Tax=Rhodococcus sp. ABRD24 TaxID=2507582 RepID=UPI00103B776D|nr:XRE family transcriptional regulator [Rhodococcus sp. ABRD24]QBJ96766.1 XRE family transcriptional regulator [Rhodococcus sp. ABRD24]